MTQDNPKNKQDKCLKKTNILVYQTPSGQKERKPECVDKKLKPPICKPKPKHIKVCTGAELRKMCPPKTCPCPSKKKSRFGILRILGFGAKAAVAASVFYITYDMGIWGTTDDTQELYSSACSMFASPQPKKNHKWDPPSCDAEKDLFTHPKHDPYGHCAEPPVNVESTITKFQRGWNKAVGTVFSGLANFPNNVMNKNKTGGDEKKEAAKCVPYSQLDEDERKKLANQYK